MKKIKMIVGIIIVLLALDFASTFKSSLFTILSLSFLPGFIGMKAKIGVDVRSLNLPIIRGIIEPRINYISLIIINIIDFLLWILHWIPGLSSFINYIYNTPASTEGVFIGLLNLNVVDGSMSKYFLTHSVLNPVFLVVIAIAVGIVVACKLGAIPDTVFDITMYAVYIVGIIMIGHFLADAVPAQWGYAELIKIKLSPEDSMIALPALLSKIWLIANATGVVLIIKKLAGSNLDR